MNFIFNNFTKDQSLKKGFFNDIIQKVFDQVGLGSRNLTLSLNLVVSKKMKELNKKYRGKDKTTDVLSFSYIKNGQLSDREVLKIIKKEKVKELGDIFIDPFVARKQIKINNYSLKHEFAMLTTHGFLHLLGYDHERSKKDAKIMFGLQEKILKKL